jgi:photosystem II stability/assembly factor-like uncharacterized protein
MTRLARSSMLLSVLSFFFVLSFRQAAEPLKFDPKLLDAFAVRQIGPANMGGRIVDLAVVESNPATFYVATASGGVWKTTDAGEHFTPVFDGQPTQNIGAVTVAPSNPDIVWVGTGEANPRNSVAWGDGVYKSTDGGKTWKNMGLKDTHHIGRIVIHPKNPDIVYVAALGHIWGPNKERGLYKTEDGGQSWQLSKFIDENTGFIDVAIDPVEPNILYAAAYGPRRDGFAGGNPETQTRAEAGLFRTEDGGKTWSKMTEGLPDRPIGRCGIDVYRKDPRIVYAVVQTDKTAVTTLGQAAKAGTNVEIGGIFRSDDKGKTWKKFNDLCPRPFYYGQIRIDPTDDQRFFVLGVQFYATRDGGKTFPNNPGIKGVHPDHHALWINPADPKHMILGNDGGLYITKDGGGAWSGIRNLPIGQFYAVAVDTRRPYHVYGGLQDNGSWGGPVATQRADGISLEDWKRVAGADGFYCAVDPTDPDVVYAEGQYGNLQRINIKINQRKFIKPAPDKQSPAYRYNWSSPLLLSRHDSNTVYFGGNHLFKSNNRGDKWQPISPDLTRGKPGPSTSTGHTLTTIAESPNQAGLLWVGTDDGRLHLTRDSGKTWTELTEKIPDVPAERWISRVECSHFAEGTAYLAIDRHRNDDRKPYLFKTTDFGATWQSLASNLPDNSPVYVVRESSRNPDLLFVGTESGLFVSLDAGAAWHRFGRGLPAVAVHDLVIHPRDRELVIGTHGRSIYVVDIAPLEELTAKVLDSPAHIFDIKPTVAYPYRPALLPSGPNIFHAANPPHGASVWFYLKAAPKQPVAVTITDGNGKTVATLREVHEAGLHQVVWDLGAARDPTPSVTPGEHTATLKVGEQTLTKKFRVEKTDTAE